MNLPDSTFDRHFSIADLAKQWHISRETVRRMVRDEPGVMRIQGGIRPGKKKMTRYSIPESVAKRIHRRLAA